MLILNKQTNKLINMQTTNKPMPELVTELQIKQSFGR